MMAQISMKTALRKYMTGKMAKVVDFQRNEVRDLAEVMKALESGALFFADTAAGEEPEFKEAVESMQETEKLKKELQVARKENEDLRTKCEELKNDNVTLVKLIEEKDMQLEKLKTEYGDLSVKCAQLQAKLPAADPEEKEVVERLKNNPKKVYRGRSLTEDEFLDAMARKRGEL